MKQILSSLQPLATAIRFLTILPFPSGIEKETDFKKSLYLFPLTGFIIGLLGAVFTITLPKLLPPLLCGAFLTLYLSGISGFLHLDGLADTSDGFLSSKPAEARLEIMRDSRIGVMGATILFGLLLVKFCSIISIDADTLLKAIIITPVAGRTAIVCCYASMPYARKSGGLASVFYSGTTKRAAVAAIILYLTILLIIVPGKALLILFANALMLFIFIIFCRKMIGGATGDTLGAVCEISEMVTLVMFAALV